jgi:hypothetical protein
VLVPVLYLLFAKLKERIFGTERMPASDEQADSELLDRAFGKA